MKLVEFSLTQVDGYPPYSKELIKAEKITDIKYKIKECPFFVEGVSLDDIVGVDNAPSGKLEFDNIVERSGLINISCIAFESASCEKMDLLISTYEDDIEMSRRMQIAEEFVVYSMALNLEFYESGFRDLLAALEAELKFSYSELSL